VVVIIIFFVKADGTTTTGYLQLKRSSNRLCVSGSKIYGATVNIRGRYSDIIHNSFVGRYRRFPFDLHLANLVLCYTQWETQIVLCF